jgi:hypothetical protein
MGVRSVLRFPVWDRGRRSLFRLTTGTLGEEQRGHVALSGSFSAIGSSSLFAVAFTGTPSSFRHRKAFVLYTRGVAPGLAHEGFAGFLAVLSAPSVHDDVW